MGIHQAELVDKIEQKTGRLQDVYRSYLLTQENPLFVELNVDSGEVWPLRLLTADMIEPTLDASPVVGDGWMQAADSGGTKYFFNTQSGVLSA